MAFDPDGVKFVLTAPDTESTEQAFSPWKQMMYASAPAQFVPRFFYKNKFEQPRNADGSAKVMTYGVRVAEEVLRRAYPDDDVVVCYPDDLGAFVGRRTVAVGVGAHNPIGTAFSTGVYSNIFGSSARPINAAESERVYQHPAIRKHRPKVIVGGAGAWQIDKTGSRQRLGIDCVINGRAESRILEVFQMAEDGGDLPPTVSAPEPSIENLVIPRRRSTYGIVEMTRGCGRQCAFCSPTLETRISVPMPDVLAAVRANTSNGGRIIFPVSEDVFIYGACAPFYVPNPNQLLNFYGSIAEEPGVDYLPLSHATIAPAVVNPGLVRDLSKVLLAKSALQNRNSSHPDKRFLAPLIGIETGSPRLAALTMSGKALPFDIQDWQEIVVEGTNILNDNNWFPVYTFIVGLPNETDDDIKQSLELLHRLKNNKVLYVPSIFTPLEDTRMASGHAMKARELTQLQWEFIMTAWKQSRDFGEMRERSRKYFSIGTKVFYHLRGKYVHGPSFKWPAMRFAGESEEKLSQHLHLNWDREPNDKAEPPRLIPKHRRQTLEEVAQMNDAQPFHIYGTSRIRDEDALSVDPLRVIVNESTGEMAEESPVRSAALPEPSETPEPSAAMASGD